MASQQNQQETNNDELSLVNLLENVFCFFRRFGWLITSITLTGLLLGFVLYKTAPKQYASTLLLHSFTLANAEQINIIQNWNQLLKEKEYSLLAKRLNCSPEMLKQVTKLEAEELQKLYTPNNPNGFSVTVMVKDNAVLDSLQHSITWGLENNDYIREKLNARKLNLQQLISKVQVEIARLDSSKKNIESNLAGTSQRGGSLIVDISKINSGVIELNEKLLDYQDQLKFVCAVQVLHSFEKFSKPASPKLLKYVVLGCIAGFALGYFLSVFLYIRSRVFKRNMRNE